MLDCISHFFVIICTGITIIIINHLTVLLGMN